MDDIVLDRSALDRLIVNYEDIRMRRGLGTAFRRVTPGQRLDALHISLAVASAGIATGEGTRDFWLNRLAPVLAETSESVAALRAAFDLTFAPTTVTGSWTARLTAPLDRLVRRFGWIISPAMLGLLALAVLIGVFIYPRDTAPSIEETGIWPDPGPSVRIRPDNEQSTQTQSALARAYVDALTVAVATLREHQGATSPITLARTFAASFRQVGSPAHLLTDMVRRFPLAPDQPIPQTQEGGLAVRHYALVAAERLAPGSGDDMGALLTNGSAVSTPSLSNFLVRFETGKRTTVPDAPDTVASGLSAYRFLPFLILLPGLVWVLRARNIPPSASALARTREEAIARRDARRAAAGAWAEARVVQIGSAGLPPLPSAARIVRALIGFREPMPRNRLDGARSIRATLQSAGDFVTVMRPRSRAVEFVLLIRRRHRHDHERARALRLVNALSNAGLTLTAYDYSPDPRFLTATGRVGAGESRSATTLNLRGLAERHFGAVLVMLTDGEELLDPLTSAPLGFLQRELVAWPRRMILTPTPSGAWGSREYRLATAIDAPVGRATLAGLADLALVFYLDTPASKGRRPLEAARKLAAWDDRVACWRSEMTSMLAKDPLPVPPPMLVADDTTLLSDHKPPPDMIDDILFSLKLWLGHGYSWFVAAAIHPHLRFDLTLWLGVNLGRKGIPNPQARLPDTGATQIPLFSENLLDRLCMLPWFRRGRIPIWLREAVFEEARPREKESARSAIEKLLQRAMPGDADSALLPVWLADWRGQKLAADDTMIGFRYDTPLLDMQPMPPDPHLWIAFGAARLAVLVAWAGVASVLVPTVDAPQSNGAWFPVLAFVATSLVLTFLLMIPAIRALPGMLYRRLAQRVARPIRRAESEKATL